ncbi:glutathionylspermidine synthase family protein [Trichocoleus sp. FACHB-591]|uniref:glutathionylspermidine synthase family protein n=1 Tax=Trichocoleus sp. FACHB-591 TaxID=2692872 RepID=UPI0016883D8F|nr:glutathionylspermidine synthase family protein [Trichocoleus sp. FACHB-591]MBD2094069.1 glutathionylspermidine synthase family protein [Trichocoleus sp. FACHB-591]
MTLTRQGFYEQHRQIFSWYNAENYACYDVLTVSEETVQGVKNAAEKAWKILLKAGEVMKALSDDALLEFGYPPEALRLIRSTTQPPFIARCDFAVTENGIFLLECNAEVATFVVETFKMNGIVANHFGKQDPNKDSERALKTQLNSYIDLIAKSINKSPHDCHIAFSALSEADEDIGTVSYLRSLCAYDSILYPIDFIEMDEDGIYDNTGKKLDIIYRLYPTEWMIEDKDPNSNCNLWDYFEPLAAFNKVLLINPVSSFILQNKALLALITMLGEDFFESNDLTGFSHFLPTFIEKTQIVEPFVAKPTFGREGKEVKIYKDGNKSAYNQSHEYADLMDVYQEYVDLPKIQLEGDIYTLQISCFLVNGIPTGVSSRIGDMVIGNTSRFLPIGY